MEQRERLIKRHVVAVIGSRSCPEGAPGLALLDKAMKPILAANPDVVVVSGGARGADRVAEQWAKHWNAPILVMKAHWDIYGKQAGFIRNRKIVEAADEVVAIWDGKSRGTAHTLKLAKELNKPITIIKLGETCTS